MNGVEIDGYAIVSRDDRIADASGIMPAALHNEADWAYFQAGLDRADWVVLGRLSHQAAPNSRGRRRIVVSRGARGLEPRADGWWWNPEGVGFGEVVGTLGGGRFAVPGGQGVFALFLGIGFTRFHLARAEAVELPGGRGVFSGSESADVALRRAGLAPGETRWLDEGARVSLRVYGRG